MMRQDRFTEQAQEVLEASQALVREARHSQWDVEHVFYALVARKDGLARERLAERRIDLVVTERTKAALSKEGYDPDFGARPLRRLIERRVENPLAKEMLSGGYVAGDRITVDVTDDGTFTFAREPGVVPEVADAEAVEVGSR